MTHRARLIGLLGMVLALLVGCVSPTPAPGPTSTDPQEGVVVDAPGRDKQLIVHFRAL